MTQVDRTLLPRQAGLFGDAPHGSPPPHPADTAPLSLFRSDLKYQALSAASQDRRLPKAALHYFGRLLWHYRPGSIIRPIPDRYMAVLRITKATFYRAQQALLEREHIARVDGGFIVCLVEACLPEGEAVKLTDPEQTTLKYEFLQDAPKSLRTYIRRARATARAASG